MAITAQESRRWNRKWKRWDNSVCNDIHYGVKPPEICPTCQVKNAYVEISSAETETICRTGKEEKVEFEKDKFREAIEKFAEKNEFEVNPDREKVTMLLETRKITVSSIVPAG